MSTHDFTKLSKEALLTHFEQERQECLEAGMDEAAIFRMHFGEDGNGGDYATWLAERKQIRPDHKYCPGRPVAIETVDQAGALINDSRDVIGEVESQIDAEAALSTLTDLQRFCFVEVELNGRTQQSVAAELSKSRETVKYAIGAARKNLKKYFS